MTRLSWFFVALALSCAAVLGADQLPPSKTIPVKPEPDTVKTTESSDPAHTSLPSTTPTTPPTTHPTTPPTTPPTTHPTTQPPTPPPTTPPTTQPPTPPPTTPPTTHAPAPPTTTAPPTPVPEPALGVFNYTDSKNITCILVKLKAQFNINYTSGARTLNTTFNLPVDSRPVSGSCGNDSQWMTLSWPYEASSKEWNNLTLEYARNATTQHYHLQRVELALAYNSNLFPNASSKAGMVLRNLTSEWGAAVSTSYRCLRPQTLTLTSAAEEATEGGADAVGWLHVSELQEEAFRTVKGHQFSIAADCEPGDVPDVVPIAVGCALGGLVLVVLAAYLIGRHRSQARGYLSM